MPLDTRKFRIFVGSPGDVSGERQLAFEHIKRLSEDPLLAEDCIIEAIGWDHTFYANTTWLSPQKAIDARLPKPSECDIAIFILWSRIGTPLSKNEYPSKIETQNLDRTPTGTEWEFFDAMRSAQETGAPQVLTFRCQRERMAAAGSDYEELIFQWKEVDFFFERFKDVDGSHRWSCSDYGSIEDFAKKLDAQLKDVVKMLTKDAGLINSKPNSPSKFDSPLVPDAYLLWLREEDTRIPLLGLDPKKPNTARLPQVYVPALTKDRQRKEHGKEQDKKYELLMTRLNEESLYIPGEPGAGKSMFCRWIAWVVASGCIAEGVTEGPPEFLETLPRNLVGKLPLLLRLREFHGYVNCGRDAGLWSQKQLEKALDTWLDEKRPGGLRAENFRRNLDNGNCLLLLDGLDEVPVRREEDGRPVYPRKALVSSLSASLRDWHRKGNRVLLTSRPYGLEPEDIRMIGLPETPLAPLPEKLQRLFVNRWFSAVDAKDAERNTRGLLEQLAERPHLEEFSGSPVLLNALCVKYDDGHRLPRDIYELYSSIVDRVLHSRYVDRTNEVEAVRRRLGAVALGMHTGQAIGASRDVPQAAIGYDELDAILARYAECDPSTAFGGDNAASGRDELLSRSGLLQSSNFYTAGFYHLTFQEFLAGERIARSLLGDHGALRDLILSRSLHPEWHPTLLFLFAALWERAEPAVALNCFAPLKDLCVRRRLESNLSPAHLTYACLELAHSKESTSHSLDVAYRTACMESLQSSLTPMERSALFDALARASLDDRPGVALRSDGLPDIDWVEIPAGHFTWQHEHGIEVDRFYIARYPVTHIQFSAFIDDPDGYQSNRWWEGLGKRFNEVEKASWPVENHPRETVNWHEAMAFCRWLSERCGYEVTLPTEYQWEKAARGYDGRIYPWGNDYIIGYANINETISEVGPFCQKATTSVGLYPLGKSSEGVCDLVGNVWEWCINKYDNPDDFSPEGEAPRALRGASWSDRLSHARVYERNKDLPHNRYNFAGFRVSCTYYVNKP